MTTNNSKNAPCFFLEEVDVLYNLICPCPPVQWACFCPPSHDHLFCSDHSFLSPVAEFSQEHSEECDSLEQSFDAGDSTRYHPQSWREHRYTKKITKLIFLLENYDIQILGNNIEIILYKSTQKCQSWGEKGSNSFFPIIVWSRGCKQRRDN